MKTVLFGSLKIGQQFFDPVSGEDFVKVDAGRAKMTSIIDLEGEEDDFQPDEQVEIDDDE